MSTSCPICLDYLGGNDVVATPCGHVFHMHCMSKWIDSNKACPECRNKIFKKNLIKLFLHYAPNDSASGTQSEVGLKVAELNAKEAELCKAKKMIKDLQEHAARAEEMHASMYQKYLASQMELDSFKHRLHKLESKSKNLVKENTILESQVKQFSDVQTILQGNQQETEEVLNEQRASLGQEVGEKNAKTMTNLISLFKRELIQLRNQKDQSLKREKDLLHQLDLKNAQLKELHRSESNLKQQLRKAHASPKPVLTIDVGKENSDQLPSQNPSGCDGQPKESSKTVGQWDVTPITIDLSEKKKQPFMKVVIENRIKTASEVAALKERFSGQSLLSFKRKVISDDGDSITRVGYNGLGGHETVVMRHQMTMAHSKPYKKNPNVKKRK